MEHKNKLSIFLPLSLRFYGGGEVIAINISKGLRKYGLDTIIYENESFNGPFRVDDDFLAQQGIVYKKIKYEKLNKLELLFLQQYPFWKTLDNSPVNLIFIYRPPSFGQIKELNKSKSKKIFLLHGIGLEKLRFTNPVIIAYQLYMRFQLLFIKKNFLRGGNYIQVLNSFQREILLRYGYPQHRIFLIGNGINTNNYYVARNDSQFIVLFVGRLENTQKGIKRLIKVVKYVKKKIPEITFTIIGSGKFSSEMEKYDFINYLGFVTEERKRQELANANLFLVTSNLEPYHLAVLEALFSGLPVVSTPVAGPSEIIKISEDFGRSVSFNSKALGDAIVDYYNQWKSYPKGYFERKKARSLKAKSVFSMEIMVENYAKMIFNVIKD
ncbi:MAG: glycosyltransferase family 4 protein [Caldisphaera sp.]